MDNLWIRLVVSTPLKNMKVNWDDYSQLNGKVINVPKHQPVANCFDILAITVIR